MLYSEEFLKRLDEHREKTIYAKIISLDLEENPIEQVEGTITSGSVNVDGTSAVRRTCSLQMVAKDIKINEYYWGLNTKFKLEIGIENKIDTNYPKIIWFKMGTYIITSFSVSYTTNAANISLQGKDKMCLLNGEVGGVINALTDFGTYDFYDAETGITTNYKLPIKQILWDAVHTYANEPFHNIILNDLDELGLELLEYQYDTPLYLIKIAGTDEYLHPIIGHLDVWVGAHKYDIGDSEHIIYDNLISSMINNNEPATQFRLQETSPDGAEPILYQAAKVEYGQTAGYHTCDLVYAGDLIANIGDSVTSVFDKIKAMLGQFEYFYDLDGRFVFQRQKSLVNTVWTPQRRDGDNELYVEALALASNSMYNFKGNILLSSIQNSPNLNNLRNDYTVWGKRKTASGGEIPIHMRYAIDNKPYRYVDMDGNVWTTLNEDEVEFDNEEKKKRSIRAEIEEQLANFKKDSNLYPKQLKEIIQESPWWHIQEWADYYAILSGGDPPGNLHPYHEMYNMCGTSSYSQFLTYWPGFRLTRASYNDGRIGANFTQEELNAYLSNPNATQYLRAYSCNVVQVYRFKNSNGDVVLAYNSHGGCVHTYGEWLSACQYVNGCTINGVTYSPFDQNYPWHLLPTLSNGRPSPGADAFQYKDYLDALGPTSNYEYKLYRIDAYCYDPKIPETLKEDFLSRLEEQYDYVDPYEGHYKYEMDWREIIYRMAIDYRRYNHDDDFEVRLAANNTPLYPRGVTGYEQYYTDLEGFWRQLYYPVFDDEEQKKQLEYQFTLWRDIKNLQEKKDIYIKGVYKPVGQKVKSLATELEENGKAYYRDTAMGKSYYHNDNMNYYISLTNGFTFVNNYESKSWPCLGSTISEEKFVKYVNAGILYTREMPSINTLYIRYNRPEGSDEIYPYLEIYNYKSSDAPLAEGESAASLDDKTHYIKVVNASDPQNPTYVPITERAISLEAKLSSYTLAEESATAYTDAQNTLNTRSEVYAGLDELKLQNQYIPANDETLLGIKTKAQGDKWFLENGSLTNLWTYCNGQSLLATGLTNVTQQKKFAEVMQLVLRKIEEAEVAVHQATNFQYQLFSDYVVEHDYKKGTLGGTPTLNNALIYDDTNLYCMTDITTSGSPVAKFYFNSSALSDEPTGARRYIYRFDLDTTGTRLPTLRKTSIHYYIAFTNFYDKNADLKYRFWNKDVFDAPESLNFWFDFLTGDGELRQFTTQAIGDRPKAVNENTIKSIYYRDTPKIIFTNAEKFASEEHKTGYNYFIMKDGYDNMFSISAQGIDCKNRIDELIYQYSYCTESVTLQSIPIYYLDVNKRIHVYDDESGIDGDYVVSKISFPLQYNGMMSITATKAPENSVTEREE